MKVLRCLMGLLTGCASVMLPEPYLSLKQAPFAEKPHIMRHDGEFFLRYRIAVEPGRLTLTYPLVAKKTADKGYYYLAQPVSHREAGAQINKPLAYDGLTEYARRNAVYWLDPDGTETRLSVIGEPAKNAH